MNKCFSNCAPLKDMSSTSLEDLKEYNNAVFPTCLILWISIVSTSDVTHKVLELNCILSSFCFSHELFPCSKHFCFSRSTGKSSFNPNRRGGWSVFECRGQGVSFHIYTCICAYDVTWKQSRQARCLSQNLRHALGLRTEHLCTHLVSSAALGPGKTCVAIVTGMDMLSTRGAPSMPASSAAKGAGEQQQRGEMLKARLGSLHPPTPRR